MGDTARWAHRMAYQGGEAPFVGWPAAGEGDGAACSIQGSSHHGVPWRSPTPHFKPEEVQETTQDLNPNILLPKVRKLGLNRGAPLCPVLQTLPGGHGASHLYRAGSPG